jgi:hypothetical protein
MEGFALTFRPAVGNTTYCWSVGLCPFECPFFFKSPPETELELDGALEALEALELGLVAAVEGAGLELVTVGDAAGFELAGVAEAPGSNCVGLVVALELGCTLGPVFDPPPNSIPRSLSNRRCSAE